MAQASKELLKFSTYNNQKEGQQSSVLMLTFFLTQIIFLKITSRRARWIQRCYSNSLLSGGYCIESIKNIWIKFIWNKKKDLTCKDWRFLQCNFIWSVQNHLVLPDKTGTHHRLESQLQMLWLAQLFLQSGTSCWQWWHQPSESLGQI